jgi:hypothetical protein
MMAAPEATGVTSAAAIAFHLLLRVERSATVAVLLHDLFWLTLH